MSFEMTHQDKITWMALWASKNRVTLDLEGTCGFGRECVGISANGEYPSYNWWDEDYNNEISGNGDVWTPEDAYHKHPAVAVLGRGEKAEAQLFEWLKWFDDNNFVIETGQCEPPDDGWDNLQLLFENHKFCRIKRK